MKCFLFFFSPCPTLDGLYPSPAIAQQTYQDIASSATSMMLLNRPDLQTAATPGASYAHLPPSLASLLEERGRRPTAVAFARGGEGAAAGESYGVQSLLSSELVAGNVAAW